VVKIQRSFTGQYLAPLLRGRDGNVAGKREAVAAE
jgi:excinuclease ABC subunit A